MWSQGVCSPWQKRRSTGRGDTIRGRAAGQGMVEGRATSSGIEEQGRAWLSAGRHHQGQGRAQGDSLWCGLAGQDRLPATLTAKGPVDREFTVVFHLVISPTNTYEFLSFIYSENN